MMPRLRAALIVVALLLTAFPAAHAASARASLALEWSENDSRSSSPLDWQDVFSVRASAARAWTRQLPRNFSVITELEAAARHAPDHHKLTAADLTLRTEARRKFGLGPLAPVVSASAAAGGHVGAIDDGRAVLTRLAVQASKRLTEIVRVSATLDAWKHHARHDTFDVSYRRAFGEIAWDITDRWQLSYGAVRLEGSFTANASWLIWGRAVNGLLGPAIQQYYTATPWVVTDAYGPGWVTYNVHGRARQWWLQLSPALTESTTLALRYENNLATNVVAVKYRQELWTLTAMHRF